MARKAYCEALQQFELAEPHCDDPIALAFHQGLAWYHLGLLKEEGQSACLKQAGSLFRCCLEPGDRHYGPALFWLGNCFLRFAGTSGLTELESAKDCFEHCLAVADVAPEIRLAAKDNLELVHLRLAQMLATPKPDRETPPNQEDPDSKEEKNKGSRKTKTNGEDAGAESQSGTTRAGSTKVKSNSGQQPNQTDDPPPPGQGNRPVPQDQAELVPLSPKEALEQLEQAAKRILGEERIYRASKARPPQQGVRDW